MLAVIKLRREKKQGSEKLFRIYGGLTVPVLAVIIIVWLLTGLSAEAVAGFAIAIGILSLLYLIMEIMKKRTTKG